MQICEDLQAIQTLRNQLSSTYSRKSWSGAEILTYIYIVDDKNEQSLLGEKDAISLGIIHFNPEGEKAAVLHQDDSADKPVRSISYTTKTPYPHCLKA